MPFEVHDKLVVAIASSALFSLDEADRIFRARGEEAYREYQRKHENEHLKPGIAFAFIQRLLSFNLSEADAPVEVVLLSRNDPDTGLRVMNSIQASNLSITRAAFVKGRKPYRYIKAFCASLFLSANEQDVKDAVSMGDPAGLVMDSFLSHDSSDRELRIAFDFDGVLADDASEAVFKEGGLPAFHQSETEQADIPCGPGPLHGLLMKVAALQKLETARAKANSGYERRLRIAIVTARNAPAHKRVVTSLRQWGIEVDETFFLGGLEKTRILGEFKPHIFFDDQQFHLRAAAEVAPCVHIPFGVRNANILTPEPGDLMSALIPTHPRSPTRAHKCRRITRPLQLTRPSVAALLRGLAAERQSLCGLIRSISRASRQHRESSSAVYRFSVRNVGADTIEYRIDKNRRSPTRSRNTFPRARGCP